MKIIVRALVGASYALLMAVAVAWPCNTYAEPPRDAATAPEELTSREGAVTVKVARRGLAPGAQSWDFEVTLDTHTQPLTQDLVAATTLIDAAGNEHAPLGWEGDPPGAHHRNGLLRFRPPTGDQAVVELRMKEIGGVPVRVFRWQLE